MDGEAEIDKATTKFPRKTEASQMVAAARMPILIAMG